MKKIIIPILIFSFSFLPVVGQTSLGEKLFGRIVLSVQENGEAWYVYPSNFTRYYLGRPTDAFTIFKKLGYGISDTDLMKIPTGLINSNEIDTDKDGLSDNLEIALGTNPNSNDSDNDGYEDKIEILSNYNPRGNGSIKTEKEFTEKHLGKIFLQTEKNGEAWYVDPVSKKKYYLSRPDIAFEIMRQFGLGISVSDLNTINITKIPNNNYVPLLPKEEHDIDTTVVSRAVSSLKNKDFERAKNYFTENISISLLASLDYMTEENISLFIDLLSESYISSSNSQKIIYKNRVYFNEGYNDYYFNVEKQTDGTWKISSL